MKRFTIRTIDGEEVLFQNVAGEASIISAFWVASGTTNAPSASNYPIGAIGSDNLGAATGLTYHVVDLAGNKSWIATGGTVQQLYGGA